jgi:hypothetical protein
MPAVAIPNLAGALTNPVEAVGAALANAPVAAADQNAALEQKGWATIAPLITAAARNPALMQNSAFTNQLQRTAQMFRINGPLLDQAIQQTRAQLGGSQVQMKPQGGAQQTGPAQPQAQQPSQPPTTQTSTPGVATDKQGNPNLEAIYQQDLQFAAKNGHLLSANNPTTQQFHQKLLVDGSRLRKTPQQIAHDVAAAQAAAGNGHPDDAANHPQGAAGAAQSDGQSGTGGAPLGAPGAGASGPANFSGLPQALPPAMQGLMAAAGIAPSGMQAFGTSPVPADMAKLIAESRPEERAQLYAEANIDPRTVPADIMNAKTVMTEQMRGLNWQRTYTSAMKMVSQGQDPTGIIQSAEASGIIDPQTANSFLSDPSVIEPMRQAAQRQYGTLLSAGLMKKATYDHLVAETNEVPSTIALHEAQTKYLGTENQWYSPKAQATIDAAGGAVDRDEAIVTSVEDGTWYQKQQVSGGGSRSNQASSLKTLLSNAQQNYDLLVHTGLQQQNSQGQSDMTGLKTSSGALYTDEIAKAKHAVEVYQHALSATVKNVGATSVGSTVPAASGATVQASKGATSPQFGAAIGKDKKNRYVFEASPGHYVYSDGSPYRQ